MREAKPFRSDCTKAELQCLVEVGAAYTGQGAICDVGCGIGGSTAAIASGVAKSGFVPNRQIHAYDLFDAYANTHATIEAFSRNTDPFREYIEIHEGDIVDAKLPMDPIEILFIDIAKTRESHIATVEKFVPRLGERWTLLNQDFGRPHLIWICLSFAVLMKKYPWTIVDDMIVVTGTGPIEKEDISAMLSHEPDLPSALAKIEILKTATEGQCARGDVPYRLVFGLAEAFIRVEYGDLDAARSAYATVASEMGTPPRHLIAVMNKASSLLA